ncbi:MAG: DUF1572 domain-containing protein [Flavobacteriaceae bacterium]|nr:DUF1572 domain-containing protein [Flavobacteriaceae bacterium]MDH3795359.1 DUF1572 domain-containing protein [Flavobacteriaceae bacterium]
MKWSASIKDNASLRMRDSIRMIEKSLSYFNDDETWQKPNAELNSMANLLLHLSGNIRQYIISSLGKMPDIRQRDLEFSTSTGQSKEEVLQELKGTVNQAIEVIKNCDETELLRRREVQGFDLDGVGIIIHVVEHLSYHTGQIAFWVKYCKEKDLGFYDGQDLNSLNP